MLSTPTLFAGFGFGLSLIVAIGAQNIYVLRQGLLKKHVLPVIAVCIISDALLIAAGVAGFGVLVDRVPWLVTFLRVFGSAFLLYYAYGAFQRVLKPEAMVAGGGGSGSLRAAMLGILGVTYLNPHVYLDTIVLMGSVANSHGDLKWTFGVGMMAASLVWFITLGFGSRLIQPFFAKPGAWRFLDSTIVIIMVTLAISILAPLAGVDGK